MISRPGDPSDENWVSSRTPTSHLIKGGVDYSLSDRTVISAYSIQNVFNQTSDRFTSITFPIESARDISQTYISDVDNRNSTYNFDIKHNFLKEGANVELEVDYSDFNSTDLADFTFEGEGSRQSVAFEDIGIKRENTTINLDFTNPFGNGNKLELGVEARIQNTRNSYETDNLDFNTSTYDFDRDIYSAYASYSRNKGKWSYQLGARAEGFSMEGTLKEEGLPDQQFKSPIFSIYPSAFLSYVPDPEKRKNTFNVSLSRRVDRPNLVQLTPIRVWSSPRITNIGNPDLIPQFTNSIEFNYTRQLKDGSITSGVFARQIQDEITRFAFTTADNPDNILFSYDNYRDNNAFGFEFSGNYKLTSFWSFNGSFDIYMQKQRGLIRDELREVDNILYNFRTNHSFKVSKRLTFQLIGLYQGPNTNLQYKRLSFYFVNIGGRYSMFDGNGTLSISFNDIFKNQQFSQISNSGNA